MRSCWAQEPSMRPDFGTIRQKLASQLEDITDQYSYLKLDNQRDYYNVVYDTDILKDTKGTVENDSEAEKFEVERMKRKDILDNALSIDVQEDHRDKTSSLPYSTETVRDRNVISNGS
ncbi:unnamed protein product [Brugia timori]|nr:unnamed protein product [Brugia timori]